jgi:hypothetical protein
MAFPLNGTVTSRPSIYSQAVLRRVADSANNTVRFERHLPDGSAEVFEQPFGGMAGSGQKFALTQVVDPDGNSVHVHYDVFARIDYIEDAAHQRTLFSYADPTDQLKVTQVTDPFGRFARFTYTQNNGVANHLRSITDVLGTPNLPGITSTYTYSALGDPLSIDFITDLTTPYGNTHFSYNDTFDKHYPALSPPDAPLCVCPQQLDLPPADGHVCSCRSVTVIDTLGRTSYVEFLHGAHGIVPSATVVPEFGSDPSSAPLAADPRMRIANKFLIYRNTFAWDPYQFDQAGGTAALNNNTLDYTKAHLTHWLHSADGAVGPSSTSRVPESTKEPLEGRVWYDYVDDSNPPNVFGVSNEVFHRGRVLPDLTTQVWTYGYTGVNVSKPVPIQLTSVTDPVGRQLAYHYDDPNDSTRLTSIVNTTSVVKCNTVQTTTPNAPFCQQGCDPGPFFFPCSDPNICVAATCSQPETGGSGCMQFAACPTGKCCQAEPLNDTLLTLSYGTPGLHKPTSIRARMGRPRATSITKPGRLQRSLTPLATKKISRMTAQVTREIC